MRLLSPCENPTIADTIRFDIPTPNPDGCPPVGLGSLNTYKVDRVTIFFVERDFSTPGTKTYEMTHGDQSAEATATAAEQIACSYPTEDVISEARRLRAIADATITKTPFYYKNAKAVKVFGTPEFPAWLRTDSQNSILQTYKDEDGDEVPGRFTLDWAPDGEAREGDYFICWTWTPMPAGDQLSAHQPFYIQGNTQITTAIPTHFTVPGKYVTLFERYLPEIFKMRLCSGDLTPEVLDGFHLAVAQSFSNIEDLANQLIDLLDSNSTHETLLPYLSNLFNLKLRGSDPTMWRRQIKRAVPLFKKKGTLDGLKEAFAQAGVLLNKFTRLWQVTSDYTHHDMFFVTDPADLVFKLSRFMIGYDVDNFSLKHRAKGSSTYTSLTNAYVTFSSTEGVTSMAWVGHNQSTPITLKKGDLIVVKYLVKTVPTSKQSQENYFQSLDLGDDRDPLGSDGNLVIPLKNWNVRMIEEDDPMFEAFIPTRHPYADAVVFGKIRTEFPYSENIYNMDEYNGSNRESLNPCHIDRDFIDDCTDCTSSKFTIDLEIHDLSNDKIKECREVVREFAPFHARLHQMNISGGIMEFVSPVVEEVDTLIMIREVDNMLAGNANDFFTRYRMMPNNPDAVRRDMLATATTSIASTTGIAYNSSTIIYCPEVRFDTLPISSNTVLEVFSPSANAGIYSTVSNPYRNTLEVGGVGEPLNQSGFTFRLSNKVYQHGGATITQDNIIQLSDSQVNYGEESVKTVWDMFYESGFTGTNWTVNTTYGNFAILDVAPNGSLILDDPNHLLPTNNTTGVSYTIVNDTSVNVVSSATGKLTVIPRGRIKVVDTQVSDIRDLLDVGYYLDIGGDQFRISGFKEDSVGEFYVEDYADGSANGIPIKVFHRHADMEVGYFQYRGMMLDALQNLEQNLGIQNGANASTDDNDILESNNFKENFALVIGTDYYQIEDIDGNIVTLSGPHVDYGTLAAGGETTLFSVIQFVKNSITIDGQDFPLIDRRGMDMVETLIEAPITSLAVTAMNASKGTGVQDLVNQNEGISFTIEYSNGGSEQGEI